jgi:hypothetical protein
VSARERTRPACDSLTLAERARAPPTDCVSPSMTCSMSARSAGICCCCMFNSSSCAARRVATRCASFAASERRPSASRSSVCCCASDDDFSLSASTVARCASVSESNDETDLLAHASSSEVTALSSASEMLRDKRVRTGTRRARTASVVAPTRTAGGAGAAPTS